MKLLIFLLSICAVSYCITNTKLSNANNPNFLGLSQDEITPSNDPVYSTPDTTADDAVTEEAEIAATEEAPEEAETAATETTTEDDASDEEEEEQGLVGTKDATVGTEEEAEEEEAEEGWELLDTETIQNTTVIQTYLKEGSEQAITAALNDGVIPDDYYFVRKVNKVQRQQVLNANNDVVESIYRYDLDTSNGKGTNVAVTYEVEYNEATQEGEIKNLTYKAKVL